TRGDKRRRCGDRLAGCIHLWQVNFERGALGRFAVDPDVAFTLFDDAVDCRESEAGTLQPFGGEERLEDVGLCLRVHPYAGITDGEHDIFTRLYRAMEAGIIFIQRDVSGLDGEPAALRHGITGISRQIHYDLVDL